MFNMNGDSMNIIENAKILETIVSEARIGIWDWNLPTGEVIYSKQWADIVGYENLQQTLATWESLVLEEDLAAANEAIDRYLAGETDKYEAEFRMRHKDGSIIWAQDKGTAAEWDENGKPTRLVGVLQDVTRIKRIEETLRENQAQLDFVISLTNLGMWDWNLKADTVEFNAEYAHLLGYEPGEITRSPKEWRDLRHPDDRPAAERLMGDCLRGASDIYKCEVRMRHKDGHYIWTYDMGRVSEWGEDGSPARVLGGHMNIDTQKKSEERLMNAVNRVAQILLSQTTTDGFESALSDGLGVLGRAIDVERVYIWKNSRGEDDRLHATLMYEWTENAEPGSWDMPTENVVFDDISPTWEETLSNNQCVNGPVKDLSESEQKRLLARGIVSIMVVPIRINNQFWGFIGFDDCRNERVYSKAEESILRASGHMFISAIIQNETNKSLIAAKEEAQVSANAKSSFLSNISHEIRTPLNAILGTVELILREKDTKAGASRLKERAVTIKSACKNLLAIVNDILDVVKMESGELTITPISYQFTSLLNDVISIVKMRADNKNLPFAVHIDSRLPCMLFGDEARIRQILVNILSNAVKFTHDGYISLTVEGEAVGDELTLKYTIADTGIGINDSSMDDIFRLFEQIDASGNRYAEGSGVGLSIAKKLCEMMGGTIDVSSEYGVGTVFTCVIKQKIVDGEPIARITDGGKKNVLVYENRSLEVDSIERVLKSLGCTYRLCSNQSELYEQLNEFDYEVLFVAALYYEKAVRLINKSKLNVGVVVLGDRSRYDIQNDGVTISMPIHCMQIANILNETDLAANYGVSGGVSMVAPTARALVVDDNVTNLQVASGLLETFEIKTDTASSGSLAIEMMRGAVYDLVFMDHMMPDMDGIDTTIAIRALGGEYFTNVPIIALTANAISGVREMFKAEGLDDYLAKPIEMSKLNAILTTWIPKEKQIKRAVASAGEEAPDFEIPGVNVRAGLRFAGNKPESYLAILATYVSDVDKRLPDITASFEKGDMQRFITYVHALKGASGSIGADRLAAAAALLESAGKEGDRAYIEKNVKDFVALLVETGSNIKTYLGSIREESTASNKIADSAYLRRKLSEMAICLESVDIAPIEAIVNDLSSYIWDETVIGSLEAIKEGMRVFDYDKIEGALAELKRRMGL